MNKISEQIRREGDLSSRSGQLLRLYEIAERVEALETLANSAQSAATGEFRQQAGRPVCSCCRSEV